MHYLMLISEYPQMLFQTELLIRSIKHYSKNKRSFFSIVVNGSEKTPIVKPSLKKCSVKNRYINANADIWRSPYFWRIPIPSRWFIEPKADSCIFIDADVIACRNLENIYKLDKSLFHGVPAPLNPLSKEEWCSLGINEKKQKKLNYFNMGFLVVPSQYVRPIGEKMLELMQATIDLVPEHYYYAGQLTVTRALSELDIQANHLPNTYNWLDTHAPINLENVFFLHYLKNREKIVSYYNMGNNANQYLYTINQVAKNVFRPRKIFL